MGCNQSKTKSAKKNKAEAGTKPASSKAGEMMASEQNRPSTTIEAASQQQEAEQQQQQQQSDAHTSQAARDAASEAHSAQQGEQPNAAAQSEETTYDNLQSASERARVSQVRDPADAPAEHREEDAAAGAGAAPGDEASSAAARSDGAAAEVGKTPPRSPHPKGNDDGSSSTTPALEATTAPPATEAAGAAADRTSQDGATSSAPRPEDASEQSEVDFQIVTEEVPATHDESSARHEDSQSPEAAAQEEVRSSVAPSTPHFEFAEDDAHQQHSPPPPPALSDAEAITPMAQEQAPEPTPQPRTERSSASHSRSGAPYLHTAAREEQRRQSFLSATASEVNAAAPAARRGQRKLSQASTPSKRKAQQERPPWVDVVAPPVEVEEEKEEGERGTAHATEEYDPYAVPHAPSPLAAAYPPVEHIDAEIRTPSLQRSERLPSGHVSREPSAPRSAARVSPPPVHHDDDDDDQQQQQQQQQYQTYDHLSDRTPSAHNMASDASSDHEPVIPAAAMPINTPKERIAARRRRSSAASAEVIAAPTPPPSSQTPAQAGAGDASRPRTPRPHRNPQRSPLSGPAAAPVVPPQHQQQLQRPPVVSPIPFRSSYTDPSPHTDSPGRPRRAPATQMPPPTAYYMDGPNSGPRRLSLDPALMAAIETSTDALVQAHTPAAPGASNDARLKDPSVMSQRALPPSTMNSAMYREPGKLPPSHLMDPVYGPATTNQPANGHTSGNGNGSAAAAGRSKPASGAPSNASQSMNGGYKHSAAAAPASPAPVVAAPRQSTRSNASNRSGASGAASVPSKAPPGSSDYATHRYGVEVDEASEHAASSSLPPHYTVASASHGAFEPQYSSPQEPRERSALPYEPSLTDEVPANAAVLRPGARHPGGAASKSSSAMQSKASWSPADGPSLHGEDEHAEAEEEEEERAAYEADSHAEEHEEGSEKSEPQDAATTTTAVATVPGSEGAVVEHQDPEWQVLNPTNEENKSLYQQAKFVVQMRNVTPI